MKGSKRKLRGREKRQPVSSKKSMTKIARKKRSPECKKTSICASAKTRSRPDFARKQKSVGCMTTNTRAMTTDVWTEMAGNGTVATMLASDH